MTSRPQIALPPHSCTHGTPSSGPMARTAGTNSRRANTTVPVSGVNSLLPALLNRLSLRLDPRKAASSHHVLGMLSHRLALGAMILRHRMELRRRSCINGIRCLGRTVRIVGQSFSERITIVLRFRRRECQALGYSGPVRAVMPSNRSILAYLTAVVARQRFVSSLTRQYTSTYTIAVHLVSMKTLLLDREEARGVLELKSTPESINPSRLRYGLTV